MHCGGQRHARLCLGRRLCTSSRRVLGRSQGTSLSATMHGQLFLTPFITWNIIQLRKYNRIRHEPKRIFHAWISLPIDTVHSLQHCPRQQWRHNRSQLHDLSNEWHMNTKNLTMNAREWVRNRFEIDRSALEQNSIPSCTRANLGCLQCLYQE